MAFFINLNTVKAVVPLVQENPEIKNKWTINKLLFIVDYLKS